MYKYWESTRKTVHIVMNRFAHIVTTPRKIDERKQMLMISWCTQHHHNCEPSRFFLCEYIELGHARKTEAGTLSNSKSFDGPAFGRNSETFLSQMIVNMNNNKRINDSILCQHKSYRARRWSLDGSWKFRLSSLPLTYTFLLNV